MDTYVIVDEDGNELGYVNAYSDEEAMTAVGLAGYEPVGIEPLSSIVTVAR